MKYSSADFEHDTPPRIVGRETEYTTAAAACDLFRYIGDVPELADTVSVAGGRKLWTPDGSKYYSDYDDIPEIAGPECLSG